jgi:hypothetical protein
MGSNRQFFTWSFYMNNKKYNMREELGSWRKKDGKSNSRAFLEHFGTKD